MLHDLPSLGCLSKIATSAWPPVVAQESVGKAARPVISRITKFFPCPLGKLPLCRTKVCGWVSAGSSRLSLTAHSHWDAPLSQMPPARLGFPKCLQPGSFPSTQITPRSQTSLHVPGGENPGSCDKSCTPVTHPPILCCPFPSCFKLTYFYQHWHILKKRGSSEPSQSTFSQERKIKFPQMCRCSKTL